MSTETFLSYKKYRYFWLSLLILIILTVLYFLDEPLKGRNGASLLGYAYGILGAIGVLYLLYYGIRKRSYRQTSTVKAALSAHTWIGVALLWIIPLHCGFSFGLNVHTLAYVLMCLCILSGIWGAVNYIKLPNQVPSHRGAGTREQLIEQIANLNRDIEELTLDKSDIFLKTLKKLDFKIDLYFWKCLLLKDMPVFNQELAAESILDLPENEKQAGLSLISLLQRKYDLQANLQQEVKIQAKLKLWLYFHVPLSIFLLVALFIHIFAVLFHGSF